MKPIALLFSLFTLTSAATYAQQTDTVSFTIAGADQLFLQQNYSVLAAHYNVNATEALIRQAKLRDNPILLTDQNLCDGRFLQHSKNGPAGTNGEVYLQLQQLIRTGGKISRLTDMASTNAHISELQLQLLVRNLQYTLHNDLRLSRELTSIIALYNLEAQDLGHLQKAMKAELDAGNISQKEYLRIQALALSLMQEETDYHNQLSDVQSELRTLIPNAPAGVLLAVGKVPSTHPALPAIDSLLAIAKQNNPEYLIEQQNLLLQQQYLKYQQALKSPDLTAGIEYDKANSYVPHYYGLTLSLPLPLVNRNQGNIASAGFSVKQEESLVKLQDQKLLSDIAGAVEKLQRLQSLQSATDPSLNQQYNRLLEHAIDAYRQRQLGLLEFIDLFEAYKDTRIRFLQQEFNLAKAAEDLNLVTGKAIW